MSLPGRPHRPAPDRSTALEQYRRRAATYDLELAVFEPLRRRAVDLLQLQPGQTVIDAGCGTGLSLPLLQAGVGAAGRLVAIEQSAEMMALARARLGRRRNVTLLCAPVEEAPIVGRADAALFHFTHDILRNPLALDHVLRHLRRGARVVATGLQWAPAWALPLNLLVWGAALRSVSSLQGLGRPWSLLAERVEGLAVQEHMFGAVFVATARAP